MVAVTPEARKLDVKVSTAKSVIDEKLDTQKYPARGRVTTHAFADYAVILVAALTLAEMGILFLIGGGVLGILFAILVDE